MTDFRRKTALAALAVLLIAVPGWASGPDFEPEILERVKNGEVVVDNLVNSNREFKMRYRAFFSKGTPADFVRLVTNHAAMPNWIPEVKKAETLAVEENGTVFRYRADVFIDLGIFQQTLVPEGTQRISAPATPGGDTLIRNILTNYTDQLQSAEENTRLVPYDGGFLVDTLVEGIGRKDLPAFAAALVRKELRARGKKLVERTREQIVR